MKIRQLLRFMFLLLACSAFGQNTRVDGVVYRASGFPAPGASIAVCSQPATIGTSLTPCTPLAPLCASLTSACTGSQAGGGDAPNPATSDGLGNYHFYIKPGTYSDQFYGSGLTTNLMVDQNVSPGTGANNVFTGSNTFGLLNNDFWVDGVKYATCAAAVTAAGNTNQAEIFIPSNHLANDCPIGGIGAANAGGMSNIVVFSHARNFDWCNPTVLSASPCNSIIWGFDDGNVTSVERHESQFNKSYPTGRALGLYTLSWLNNATMTGVNGGIDGFSGEANTAGTLTGTVGLLVPHEADSLVGSSGGSITEIDGVEGYAQTTNTVIGTGGTCLPGSTCTQVGTIIGIRGIGCSTLTGAVPSVACIGVQGGDQTGKSTGRNYSFESKGMSILDYSGAAGLGGMDMEDTGHANHRFLYVDSSNNTNIAAIGANGLILRDSAGNARGTLASGASSASGTLLDTSASTSQKYIQLSTTNNTGFYFGIESHAGGFFTGAAADESVLYSAGNPLFLKSNNTRFAGSITASGTGPTITGTGACATITTQVGGTVAGSAKCTGATAASTLTITFATSQTNGYVCTVQDETTRANLFQQTAHAASSCTLTATSVTQNDIFVFSAIGF